MPLSTCRHKQVPTRHDPRLPRPPPQAVVRTCTFDLYPTLCAVRKSSLVFASLWPIMLLAGPHTRMLRASVCACVRVRVAWQSSSATRAGPHALIVLASVCPYARMPVCPHARVSVCPCVRVCVRVSVRVRAPLNFRHGEVAVRRSASTKSGDIFRVGIFLDFVRLTT